MGLQLAKCDTEYFDQNGAVCLRNVFDKHSINLLRQGVERNMANPTKFFTTIPLSGPEPTFFMDYNAWTTIPEYEEFVRQSPIGEIAGLLMGWAEVNFFQDNFLWSLNDQLVPTPWHQDSSYYDVSGLMCSIWVPLDEITQQDSVAIVAGSHKWGRTFLPKSFSGERERLISQAEHVPDTFELMIDIDKEAHKYRILRWNMNIGDCIVFDGRTVHGRYRTASGESLRRITFRFVGEDAYWDDKGFPWSSLDMGHDNLRPGDRLNCELFPLIWSQK